MDLLQLLTQRRGANLTPLGSPPQPAPIMNEIPNYPLSPMDIQYNLDNAPADFGNMPPMDGWDIPDVSPLGQGDAELPIAKVAPLTMEWLGAKEPDEGGLVRELLALRRQTRPEDFGQASVETLMSGKPVSSESIAQGRFDNEFNQIAKLAEIQNASRRIDMLGKGGGGNSVFAQVMAAMGEDPELSALPLIERIRIAQNKVGTNLTIDPSTGQVVDMSGAAQGLGNLSYGQTMGKQNAEIETVGDIEANKIVGKETGEAQALLNSMEASFPKLQQTVSKLSELGKKATYTMAGRGLDILQRESGQSVGPDAVARTEYISMVDNEILPLLRQTFGAQFTQKEGESLKITLGDPNKSPEEKDAVLRSFIQNKITQMESLRRQTGAEPAAPPQNVIRYDAQGNRL